MEFRKYEKIHRLGKEETDGILEGLCYIQEKIDGANVSIWRDNTGTIRVASRNRELTDEEEFNGFVPYVKEHTGISNCLNDNPGYRLYGEWLVRHTIQYNETAYKKFYLFDIHNGEKYLDMHTVRNIARNYEIDFPKIFDEIENPSLEQLKECVGKSEIGEKGEGIVIKNHSFINGFGDHCYAKMVTEQFKEDNAVTFGGNNKHSDTYWEMYVVNKYVTLPRVEKVMRKIEPEINERFDMKHIPRICNSVYHDMLTEEIWDIAKKVQALDFKKLQRVAFKKAKQIYVDVLNNSISIADVKK